MAPVLELDLLRCFVHVVESGGFTPASRRLHLSQPAVSLKIQRLEALVGCEILERTKGALTLTVEGELLLGYARRFIALNEEALRAVNQGARGGHLNLGVTQQFPQNRLFQLLSKFKKTCPEVTLGIEIGTSGNLLKGMNEGSFDVVIAGEDGGAPPISDGMIREGIVGREPMRWVQAKTSKLSLRDGALPLVVLPPPCGHRRLLVERLDLQGRPWRISYSSGSLSSVQAAIEAGWGIGILPGSFQTSRMRRIGKEERLPPLPDSTLVLYRRKLAGDGLASKFVDLLRGEIMG